MRTCVEMAFGVHNCEKEPHFVQKGTQLSNAHDGVRRILLALNHMTNKGLCGLIKILTGGMIKFKKTSWSMKRTIKELLPKVISDRNDSSRARLEQLMQLVEDPKNYRGNQMVHSNSSESYRAAAVKVLDGLEDFPTKTLNAMNRKLRGFRGYIPSMKPPRSGQARDNLLSIVKKRIMEMLADLGEVCQPSERLAEALGVAGLTLKLIMNRPAVRDFRKFSPEIEALQNDIAKAIHLLNNIKKVSLIELRKVQLLLDPNSQLSDRSLRIAVRSFLTEYLFECADMEEIPDCVVETLDIINRRSQLRSRRKHSSSKSHSSPQYLMKEAIQKEIENVLTLSAQAKEVVLGLHPKHEFDKDFTRAYMEDFEGSDTPCISGDDEQERLPSQDYEFDSYSSHDQTESMGETNPVELNSPVSMSERDSRSALLSPKGRSKVPLESMRMTGMDSDETSDFLHPPSSKKSKLLDGQFEVHKHYPSECIGESGLAYSDSLEVTNKQKLSSLSISPARDSIQKDLKREETTCCSPITPKYIFSDFPAEETNAVSQQSRSGNLYLDVQEACDITTMVAYGFVGHMLDKLVKIEGLELYQGDRSYLRSDSSVREDSEGNGKNLYPFFYGPVFW